MGPDTAPAATDMGSPVPSLHVDTNDIDLLPSPATLEAMNILGSGTQNAQPGRRETQLDLPQTHVPCFNTDGKSDPVVSGFPEKHNEDHDEDPKVKTSSESHYDPVDSDHDSHSSVSSDGGLQKASFLSTAALYEAYTTKLRRYDEDMDEDTPEKAPEMIRGVVDYVRTLEERITKLEEVDTKDPEPKSTTRAKHGHERSDPGPLLLTVKFFHAGGELSSSGGWVNNTRRKGSYQCDSDPNYFIRVLYRWNPGALPETRKDKENPKPDDIDILAFGVVSEPITEFLNHCLRIQTDVTNVVRIGKPFRPLIRSYDRLRDQLDKLKVTFR